MLRVAEEVVGDAACSLERLKGSNMGSLAAFSKG